MVYFWETEYISQAMHGESVIDILTHTILKASGASEEAIESSSIWHFIADPTLDFIIQEVVANLISLGIGTLGGALQSAIGTTVSVAENTA